MGTYRIPAASLVSGWSLTPAQQLQNATLIQNALDHAIVPPPADEYNAVVIPIGIWDIGENIINVPNGMSLFGEGPDQDFIKRIPYQDFEAHGTILVSSSQVHAITLIGVKDCELASMSVWAPSIPATSETALDALNPNPSPPSEVPYNVTDYNSVIRLSGGWNVLIKDIHIETCVDEQSAGAASAVVYCDNGVYTFNQAWTDFGLYQVEISNIRSTSGYVCIIGKDVPNCMVNNIKFTDLWIRSFYARRVGVINLDSVYCEAYSSTEYGFYFKKASNVSLISCSCDTGLSTHGIKVVEVESLNGIGIGLGSTQVDGIPMFGSISSERGDQRRWAFGNEEVLLRKIGYGESANTKLEMGAIYDPLIGSPVDDNQPYKYRFYVGGRSDGQRRQFFKLSAIEYDGIAELDVSPSITLDKRLVEIDAGSEGRIKLDGTLELASGAGHTAAAAGSAAILPQRPRGYLALKIFDWNTGDWVTVKIPYYNA